MGLGGESAALAGFEVHYVIACPSDVALPMMLENLFAALAQHVQGDSEAAIGRFGTGYGLKKKIDRRSATQGGQLSGDMREAAGLGGDFVGVHEAIQRAENRSDGFDRVGGGIHAD